MKIKSIKKLDGGRKEMGEVRLEVTLEHDGKEYSFVGDAWELLDESRFKEILRHWKYNVIPKREMVAKMSDEEIEAKIKKLKSIDTSTI